MKFFITPSSKTIIATLRLVTIERPELTFLLMLYFHDLIIALEKVIEILNIKHLLNTGTCVSQLKMLLPSNLTINHEFKTLAIMSKATSI